MTDLVEDLRQWADRGRRSIDATRFEPRLEQIGRVAQVGDGVAIIKGLPETRLDELLVFEGGVRGLAVDLGEDVIGCVLLGPTSAIRAGSVVRGTGEVARAPVGEALLGRVVDALGVPLDGGEPLAAVELAPVEQPAPAIVDRALVTRPLATGLLVVDAMIPLGRGQRELIIGDRGTGKTAIAVDAIINQRASDVICIYAAIGQKASSVAQVVDAIRRHHDLVPLPERTGGPARYHAAEGMNVRLGLITPLTNNFCADCNRMRMTCEGKIFMCLGHEDHVDFRTAMREGGMDAVQPLIDRALRLKPARHDFHIGADAPPTAVRRHMSVTGG